MFAQVIAGKCIHFRHDLFQWSLGKLLDTNQTKLNYSVSKQIMYK